MDPLQQPTQVSNRNTSDVGIVARGLCMGIADVIPGVSGGTVALVTGIYRRLVTSISRFDGRLVQLLRVGEYAHAAQHVDIRFLIALAGGIGVGFVLGVKFVAELLESDTTRPFLLAAFMGMIVAGAWIVFKSVLSLEKQNRAVDSLSLLLGIFTAALITQLARSTAEQTPPLWYLFFCGVVGICAMILPGISGAAMLILLGVYQFLIGVAKEVVSLQNLVENAPVVICFGVGCAVGLGTSTRVVRRLLESHPGPTLGFLCGLMLGSLPLLWPFQEHRIPDGGAEDFKSRIYTAVWPDAIDWVVAACALTAIVAAVSVIVTETLVSRASARRRNARPSQNG